MRKKPEDNQRGLTCGGGLPLPEPTGAAAAGCRIPNVVATREAPGPSLRHQRAVVEHSTKGEPKSLLVGRLGERGGDGYSQ
jgi:hypothetical protein